MIGSLRFWVVTILFVVMLCSVVFAAQPGWYIGDLKLKASQNAWVYGEPDPGFRSYSYDYYYLGFKISYKGDDTDIRFQLRNKDWAGRVTVLEESGYVRLEKTHTWYWYDFKYPYPLGWRATRHFAYGEHHVPLDLYDVNYRSKQSP